VHVTELSEEVGLVVLRAGMFRKALAKADWLLAGYAADFVYGMNSADRLRGAYCPYTELIEIVQGVREPAKLDNDEGRGAAVNSAVCRLAALE